MSLFVIIFLAVGLAMDCFAVSVAQGATTATSERGKVALTNALLFGFFQGGMPLIAYYLGSELIERLSFSLDQVFHYISAALLALVAAKMFVDAVKESRSANQNVGFEGQEWTIKLSLLLAVATSIDAFATGLIFLPYPEKVWSAVWIINAVSVLFSLAGFGIGMNMAKHLPFNPNYFGGIILSVLAVKILLF